MALRDEWKTTWPAEQGDRPMVVARHLVIHGRVQGVFYRGWTVETARALGLRGWVRNRNDGTVEALLQGETPAIERFIDMAWDGPAAARVREIEAHPVEPDESLDLFVQRPTA